MKMKYITLILLLVGTSSSMAKNLEKVIDLSGEWRFSIGDEFRWKEKQYNDSEWEKIQVPSPWEEQGFFGYDGYAWYRKSFNGSAVRKKQNLYLQLGHIDDVDEVYINGQLIGFSGQHPPHFKTSYQKKRIYFIPSEYINFYGSNTIAVRVYDSVLGGGITSGRIGIYKLETEIPYQFILEGVWEMKMNKWRSRKTKFFANWKQIMVPMRWDQIGIRNYRDIAWYRKYFNLPNDFPTGDLSLIIGKIDDFDEVYINGVKIGETNDGRPFGDSESWRQHRVYPIPASCLKKNEVNTILVKVLDIGIDGGIYEGPITIVPSSYVRTALRTQ